MSTEKQRQLDEINRPRNKELFNNLDKQYQEIAKVKSESERIDIIEADIKTGMRNMEKVNPKVYRGLNYRSAAKHLDAIGYRKQSKKTVEVVRCKDCKFNVANMEKSPLDLTDYSGDDIVCSYFMTDGLEPTDFCSYGAKMKGGE